MSLAGSSSETGVLSPKSVVTEDFSVNFGQILKLGIAFSHLPPQIALIALFSDEVRPMCNKILGTFPVVQMMEYKLKLRLSVRIFPYYIFYPNHHLILFEPVM